MHYGFLTCASLYFIPVKKNEGEPNVISFEICTIYTVCLEIVGVIYQEANMNNGLRFKLGLAIDSLVEFDTRYSPFQVICLSVYRKFNLNMIIFLSLRTTSHLFYLIVYLRA